MATTPPVSSAPPSSSRRLPLLVIGLVIIFGCIAVAAVAAVLLLRNRAGSADQPAVAYIMDISPRMSLSAGTDTRLAVGRSIFADVMRRSDPDLTAGFRVFGAEAGGPACEDTELLIPFAQANRERIADQMTGLSIGGSSESALAAAMVAAVRDLTNATGERFMVVVTGGSDSCNPDAGRLIAAEAERNNIDLQTFVVGFQVPPEEAEALRRMVEQSGGTYLDAADGDELRRALQSIQDVIELGTPIEVGETPTEGIAAKSPTEPSEVAAAPEEIGGYQPQTACDHPYFPLRQGAHWDYSYDGLPATWDVTAVSGDLGAATATVVISLEGLTITYNWDCGADGVFFYQTGVFDFSAFPGSVTTTLTGESGSPIPPPEAMLPGASWTSAYTMEISTEVEGFAITISNQVEETHTAGEFETRSTAAGDFTVLPVSNAGTTTTTSFGTSVVSSSSGTCWFALGVGWLGCNSTSGGEISMSELLSYSVP